MVHYEANEKSSNLNVTYLIVICNGGCCLIISSLVLSAMSTIGNLFAVLLNPEITISFTFIISKKHMIEDVN